MTRILNEKISIVSHARYLSDKKFPTKSYVILRLICTYDKQLKILYIPKDKLKQKFDELIMDLYKEYAFMKFKCHDLKIEDIEIKLPTFKTLKRDVKYLLAHSLLIDLNDKYQLIDSINNGNFVKIKRSRLRYLLICKDKTLLKIYILLEKVLTKDKDKLVTRDYVLQCLGYNINNNQKKGEVGKSLEILYKLKFVFRYGTTEHTDGRPKTKYFYRAN